MNESVFDILVAAVYSGKIAKFINGTTLELTTGQQIHIKHHETKKLFLSEGYRFSKYSFVSSVVVNDKDIYYGYGEGNIKLLSLQKSIVEAIERAVFKIIKNNNIGTQNTNGWAAHPNLGVATRNSHDELLERDAILVHWLTKAPMMEVMPLSFPNWLQTWMAEELQLAPQFNRLSILTSTLGYVPTITVVLMDNWGHAVMSHATGSTFEGSIKKAIAEVCRLAQLTEKSHFSESSLSLQIPNSSLETLYPEDHAMVYAYHLKFPTWIFGDEIDFIACQKNWIKKRKEVKFHDFKFNVVTKTPIVVGYGESKDVQRLFFGHTENALDQGILNIERLKKINNGRGLVNAEPHCIA